MTMLDPTRELVRISGKNLGALALKDVCNRCVWLKLKMKYRLPFGVFPGIFSSIDAYSKRIVHAHCDRHRGPPPWLASLGDVVTYIDPPHWSRFQMVDREFGVLLTGAPDGIFVLRDGRLLIGDYKTARHTRGQDALFPVYTVQLNVYAQIAEHVGLGTVAGLALIYTEPVTEIAGEGNNVGSDGFVLPFVGHVVAVDVRPEILRPLLGRVRELHDLSAPPAAGDGCKDCALVEEMFRHLQPRSRRRVSGRGQSP
jgi:hypothetical protein